MPAKPGCPRRLRLARDHGTHPLLHSVVQKVGNQPALVPDRPQCKPPINHRQTPAGGLDRHFARMHHAANAVFGLTTHADWLLAAVSVGRLALLQCPRNAPKKHSVTLMHAYGDRKLAAPPD